MRRFSLLFLMWFGISLLGWSGQVRAQEATQESAQTEEKIAGEVAYSDGFEEGASGEKPKDWFTPTEGFALQLVAEDAAAGQQAMRLAPAAEQQARFGTVLRQLPAQELAGKRIKLTSKVKVVGQGKVQMWLRADRSNGQPGAFDNMGNRPIFKGDWQDAKIELEIDPDVSSLVMGFMSIGGATLLVDEVELRVMGAAAPVILQPATPPAPLIPRGLENVAAAARALSLVRFFVASDQAKGVVSWDHVAVELMEQAEPAKDAAELAQVIERVLQPLAPTLQVWPGKPEDQGVAPPLPAGAAPQTIRFWRHLGAGLLQKDDARQLYSSKLESQKISEPVDSQAHLANFRVRELGGGVCCRVPVRVYADEAGTIPHGQTPEQWAEGAVLAKLTAQNRATRLAGFAMAWGVFQHFYPYFDVVPTDWNAVLLRGLAKAAEDADERAFLATLQEMVAQLQDGHGAVIRGDLGPNSFFPLLLEWAGEDLVVTGKLSGVPDEVKLGDVVESIDGQGVADLYAEVSKRISAATDGWRRSASQQWFLAYLKTDANPSVTLRRPGSEGKPAERYTVKLSRALSLSEDAAGQKRPADGTEVAPGIVYVNLDGADLDVLNKLQKQLNDAKAIIFDVRGYPGEAAYQVIQKLIQKPVQSAQWNVPIVTLPDREGWEWYQAPRWNVLPLPPRWRVPVAFLTDGRAISYAESIMGIIEHHQLGEIVGSPTAGTNGNVNPFMIPGSYQIMWTGMQVLKHDGSQHHGIGIRPTVPVTPTAAGIAAGRDEVLEKAIETLQGKIK